MKVWMSLLECLGWQICLLVFVVSLSVTRVSRLPIGQYVQPKEQSQVSMDRKHHISRQDQQKISSWQSETLSVTQGDGTMRHPQRLQVGYLPKAVSSTRANCNCKYFIFFVVNILIGSIQNSAQTVCMANALSLCNQLYHWILTWEKSNNAIPRQIRTLENCNEQRHWGFSEYTQRGPMSRVLNEANCMKILQPLSLFLSLSPYIYIYGNMRYLIGGKKSQLSENYM